MFGSIALDIVVGLVFIFLLYSLLATIVLEIIATWMGLRAKVLEKAIVRMLNDSAEPTLNSKDIGPGKYWANRLKIFFTRINSFILLPSPRYGGTLASQFYNQPSVKYLAEDEWHSKPEYITRENFSKAVIDILRGDIKPGDDTLVKIRKVLFEDSGSGENSLIVKLGIHPETLSHLRTLYIDAKNDIDNFRTALESWFEDTMKRATGWYKRHIQVLLFLIGFFIAMVFNVDTFGVIKVLSNDKEAREQLVKLAAETQYESTAARMDSLQKDTLFLNDSERLSLLDSAYKKVSQDMKNANKILGMGYYLPEGKTGFFDKIRFIIRTQVTKLSVFGWLITALAISLGSPFWFDLLNKIMKLRGAKREDGDEDKKITQSATIKAS
jgi:hypothetical protein